MGIALTRGQVDEKESQIKLKMITELTWTLILVKIVV